MLIAIIGWNQVRKRDGQLFGISKSIGKVLSLFFVASLIAALVAGLVPPPLVTHLAPGTLETAAEGVADLLPQPSVAKAQASELNSCILVNWNDTVHYNESGYTDSFSYPDPIPVTIPNIDGSGIDMTVAPDPRCAARFHDQRAKRLQLGRPLFRYGSDIALLAGQWSGSVHHPHLLL